MLTEFLAALLVGVTTGSVYSLVGLGAVLTYKTSGIFNLAHGALATASAYVFYELHVEHHVSWQVAVLAVLLLGVVFGLVLERLANGLRFADLAPRIVATVGVLLVIQAVCVLRFGDSPLNVLPFLPVSHVTLFGVVVTYDRIIIVAIALLATLALYAFFRATRLGKAMRAVVDNSQLLDLSGTNPVRVRQAAWMIGCAFATLSGPLLVQILGRVDPGTLTALVVQAFAAAALGSFTSLPITYAGGLLVGVAGSLAQHYFGSADGILSGLPAAMPFVILFVLMLVMPRARLALGAVVSRKSRVRWTAPPRVQAVAILLVIGFLATVPMWADYRLGDWTTALTFVILFLSLGLLVRTAGQVSLCHATFAAVGAVALSKLIIDAGIPWPIALVLAGLVAAPIGALLAIPALRLSGVFLALATFGFGILVQNMFYLSDVMFGSGDLGMQVHKPHLSWLNVDTPTGFYYVALSVTVLIGGFVVVLVRSRLGRLLRGVADSPLALSTSGLSVNVATVLVFSISASLAAVAGGVYGAHVTALTGQSFVPFLSATYLTLIIIAAGAEPWYALMPALAFRLVPAYWHPDNLGLYLQITFGVSAICLALFPPAGLPAGLRARIDRIGRTSRTRSGQRSTADDALVEPTARVVPGELAVQDLSVNFGGISAVRNVSLVASTDRITGLIGPNGAGKTTTFNACSGLVRPSSGKILLNGDDISRSSAAVRARQGLGRTYQHVELWNSLTVRQNVELTVEARLAGRSLLRHMVSRQGDRARVTSAAVDAIARCGLEDVAEPTVGSLSTGKRRLVEVARCLAGGFDIILLDEPSSGLDQNETQEFGRLLRRLVDERGVGILLVEHDMRLVMDVCEYIYVLDFGEKIFEGSAAEVRESQVVRDAYLGSESEALVAGTGEPSTQELPDANTAAVRGSALRQPRLA